MTQQDRLKYLLNRYAGKQTSPTEEQELYALIEDDANEQATKSAMMEMIEAEGFAELDRDKADRILKKIFEEQPAKKVRIFPIKWAAAAAVIILLGIGSYFAFFKQTEKPSIAKTPAPVQNDLQPGGNKAILTLDGGQTLVLDSAKNGALAVQGNTQITKGNGTLAYNEQQQVGIAQKTVYNSVSTPKGGQYQLTLSDGSKVWLNAASSIRFPTAFIGNERRVEIKGEVYFEVAHDSNRPFHVNVNGMDVQVLGTHFNVNAYSDEESIRTTLLEGSVKVSAANKSVTIKPGQQAQMNGGNAIGFVVNRDVNIDQVMKWKNGEFNFDNVDLQTIMRQLARWYDVDVVYQGNVPMKTFKGEISRNVPASKVLDILAYAGVHFKIDGKKIIVTQ